jgi:predicted PolB exonuclease-like 3'-5' exonuclease
MVRESRRFIMYLVFDIETIPDQDIIKKGGLEMPESYVKYGNAIKEETKERIYNEHLEKWNNGDMYKFMSLNPLYAQVISIGYIVCDNELEVIERGVIYSKDEESKVFYEFGSVMAKYSDPKLVGWNIKSFDLQVLFKRSLRSYKLWSVFTQSLYAGKYSKYSLDLMDMWDLSKRTKMKDACYYLGIKSKSKIDGSQVYDYYKANKHNEIKAYCMEDVDCCYEIMKKIF